MPELWILCIYAITLDPLKLHPHMKFHFNSISCKIKSVTQKVCRMDRQTDGQTDEQTDDGEVIPKCHLCMIK